MQRIESAEIRAADHIREAANEGILLTPIKRSDGRPGRNQRNRQMTNESKTPSTMKTLIPDQLDEVSGGWGLIWGAFNTLKTGSPTGDLCDVPSERAKMPNFCALPKA